MIGGFCIILLLKIEQPQVTPQGREAQLQYTNSLFVVRNGRIPLCSLGFDEPISDTMLDSSPDSVSMRFATTVQLRPVSPST